MTLTVYALYSYCFQSPFGFNPCPRLYKDIFPPHRIKYPTLFPSGYEVKEFFIQNNINPTVKYEISDDQSIIALVKADLGINIRPELVLTNAPTGINAIDFEKEAYRIIGLGITKRPSHATKSFISIVSDLYNSIHVSIIQSKRPSLSALYNFSY